MEAARGAMPYPSRVKAEEETYPAEDGCSACHCSLFATTIYFEERSACGENGLLVPSTSNTIKFFQLTNLDEHKKEYTSQSSISES